MHTNRLAFLIPITLAAQVAAPVAAPAPETAAEKPAVWRVEQGTRIPLAVMRAISTRNASVNDQAYLQVAFPVFINGRLVIPEGSYVTGTVTQVKRARRVKGKAELFVRFDALILPNGVSRDLRARVGGIDGSSTESVDKSEGKIKGDSEKAQDAMTVGGGAMVGATVGGLSTMSRTGSLMGIGVGAAAGMIGVLATRGPDATLEQGTTVDMVLDRNLSFSEQELDFSKVPPGRGVAAGMGEMPRNRNGGMVPGRRW